MYIPPFYHLLPSAKTQIAVGTKASIAVLAIVLSIANAGAESHPGVFPPIKLRGYGTLAGNLAPTQIGEQPGSVLKISCDNEEKAKLVQAKYLSDLQLLPGVRAITVTGREGSIPAYEIEEQGAILAARDGTTVYVLSASSTDALAKLESGDFIPERGHLTFAPETEVPMYLDRWDKYGFRFYYTPWATPPKDRDYDITQNFAYAEKQDHSGLVLWATPELLDAAEGLTNDAYWLSAAEAAREKNVPIGINNNAGFDAPSWLMNRYRDQRAQKMPGYVGCYYDSGVYNLGAPGWLSWSATTGEDALLSILQQSVRRLTKFSNVTSFMEPHAEMQHGVPDIMLEYGPVADTSYRAFLKKKYPAIKELNKVWETGYASWDKVRVPELVSFLGWGPEVVDLGGEWRIGYEPSNDKVVHAVTELGELQGKNIKSAGAPEEWFSSAFDDSSWPTLIAPGNDLQTLLPRWPAVFRRSVEIPADWSSKHPKAWLYVWDGNRGGKDDLVKVALNGKTVGTGALNPGLHLAVFEISSLVKTGNNIVAIRAPQGRLNYKVYISPDEPKRYPDLGPGKNTQWADFVDWDLSIRAAQVRRGMEMIRQVDPNRGIMLMSPDVYAEGLKDLAKMYGGDFHNTGYMGGWWCDRLPAWMRGIGMPFSVEPGNPAHNVTDFKNGFGHWITEGVNAVDYFMNIGDVMWDPAIKQYFEENLRVIKLIGKYHAPFADVAALYSNRMEKLMGFPWNSQGVGDPKDPAPFMGSGFVSGFEPRGTFRWSYESDAVTESSFTSGDAERYRVIVDSDTAVMDEKTVSNIEKYVKNGGVFVTYGETGRHTPTVKDKWPMERLTGYRVTKRIAHPNNQPLHVAAGQEVFSGNWEAVKSTGLSMEKMAPEAVNLMLWKDGSVAIGMRPIGKGYIVQWGCWPDTISRSKLFAQIFQWQKLASIPAHYEPADAKMMLRHFISNNGLYDVWVVWGTDKSGPVSADVVFSDNTNPAWGIQVKDGSKVTIENRRLPVKIEPLETKIYLTPRNQIAAASTEWFNIQRGWWQGTTPPPSKPLPVPEHKRSVDLTEDWAFKAVAEGEKVDSLVGVDVDDSKWDRVPMGIWSTTAPGRQDIRHAVLRKRITIPAKWGKGEATLWLQSWNGNTFRDQGQIYIDGKPFFERPTANGAAGIDPDGILKVGSTHTIAVDISATRTLNGAMGPAWLWFWADPVSSLDLAGKWDLSLDGLTYKSVVDLPGPIQARALRRKIVVPANQQARRAVLNLETVGRINSVIINGNLVARHHHNIGQHWQLDITPWIHFGAENEVQVIAAAADKGNKIDKITLNFYNPVLHP